MKNRIVLISVFLVLPFILWSESFRVDAIHVSGNTWTKKRIILQELAFHKGDVIKSSNWTNIAKQSEQNLKNLQILADARISLTNIANSNVVNVKVEDRWSFLPSPNLYFNSSTGWVVGGSVSWLNFLGNNQTVFISAVYNRYNKSFGLSFTEPRVFGSLISFTGQIAYQESVLMDSKNYYANESLWMIYANVSAYLNAERTLAISFDNDLQFTHRDVLTNLNATVSPDPVIWDIGAQIQWGRVNSEGYVKNGQLTTFYLSKSPILSISEGYNFIFDHRSYLRLGKKNVLALRLNLFDYYREATLTSDNAVRGLIYGEAVGNTGWIANAEWRPYIFTIKWPTIIDLYLPVFADSEAIYKFGEGFGVDKAISSAGVGLVFYPKYITMLFRIDFAVQLNRLAASEQGAFYYGFSFNDLF